MLKYSLITALLAFSGLMANAQTTAAPAAASASASAKASAKAATPASATPAAKPAAKPAEKAAAAGPEVKKSKAGICHEKASTGYKQTKNFTEFKTLDECIKSGGRAAKK
jgi:cytochrome c5